MAARRPDQGGANDASTSAAPALSPSARRVFREPRRCVKRALVRFAQNATPAIETQAGKLLGLRQLTACMQKHCENAHNRKRVRVRVAEGAPAAAEGLAVQRIGIGHPALVLD